MLPKKEQQSKLSQYIQYIPPTLHIMQSISQILLSDRIMARDWGTSAKFYYCMAKAKVKITYQSYINEKRKSNTCLLKAV